MEKPKILYHGSPKKLIGYKLLPKKAIDLGNKKENLHKAVYATDFKNSAIAMAIICSKGVNGSSLNFEKKSKGVVYNGWPKQKIVYLHLLPKKAFKQTSKNSHQYFSEKSVKPIKTIKIKVKNNLNLIIKATKKELFKYCKKYKLYYNKKDKTIYAKYKKNQIKNAR